MNDIVSIIMPAYNSAKYIGEAIESVINQTYTNWELIIVNDCSTDETEDVVIEYCLKHKNIICLKNEINKGVSYTRLKGIQNASGEYIAFLDSDDTWESDKIRLQMEVIKNGSAVLRKCLKIKLTTMI